MKVGVMENITYFIADYFYSLFAVFVMILTVFVQGVVASAAHRTQKSYVPGIVDPNLGPESFVFRSHRTFMNSLENTPFMILLIILAVLTGYSASVLLIISWVYAIFRIAHMVTYYLIATCENPSLRSYFFMVAVLAQLMLFVLLGWHFAHMAFV